MSFDSKLLDAFTKFLLPYFSRERRDWISSFICDSRGAEKSSIKAFRVLASYVLAYVNKRSPSRTEHPTQDGITYSGVASFT
jgi:hypothetical protein